MPDPVPAPSPKKEEESSQWWLCHPRMHGKGTDPLELEWRAGLSAVPTPDPAAEPEEGSAITECWGAAAAVGKAHWEVTGVAMAAQWWEEAGGMGGGVGAEIDKPRIYVGIYKFYTTCNC
jgi:hypothetical protein